MMRIFWIGCIIGLFLYSFTQIDLSLTLSQSSVVQSIEKSFQNIGYSQRPLSTEIYVILLGLLFMGYITYLVKAHIHTVSEKHVWQLIGLTAGILLFSYSAFSYDIFNYMFGAREIVVYHANPYIMPPWDFKTDHMLPFMRNIDKVYVYGPLSLVLTVPLSILGFGTLLPTFYLFKLLSTASYILCCYMIWKILKKFAPDSALTGLVFFALNPLVLVEGLVSAHNDMWMMSLALLAVWFLLTKKYVLGIVLLVASVLTKQVTVFLFPLFLLYLIPLARKYMLFSLFLVSCILLQLIGGWLVLQQRELQPWYFLWILPFIALFPKNTIVYATTIGLTLALLLKYIPYLLEGNWEHLFVYWNHTVLIIPLICLCVSGGIFFFQKIKYASHP